MKLFIAIYLSIVFILGLFYLGHCTLEEIENNYNRAIVELPIVPKRCSVLNQFSDRLLEASPKLYRNPGNNCYDQSKKLQNDLRTLDIESSLMIGKDRKHAWIAVWIDAIDGSFISPGKYEIMEVRQSPTDVICQK